MSNSEHHGHGSSMRSLLLILIGTFIFGFITGVILFLQSNTGNEGDGGIKEDSQDLTIIVYMYGGCESLGCPSYRITENGSYTYITRTREQGGARYEDSLSDTQYHMLLKELGAVDFAGIQNTKFAGTCPITFDGVAYRYDITYKSEHYLIDSCVVSVDGNSLFKLFTDYFKIFSAPDVHE